MTASPWCRVLILEQGEGLWGAQKYLLRLAPLLEERGVEQILAAPAQSATALAWRESGRRHLVLPLPSDRSVRDENGRFMPRLAVRELRRSAVSAVRTARLARGVGADIIHANSHWSHLEGVVAARLSGRRVTLHLHEVSEPDGIGRLRGLGVLGADASVAVSSAVARSLPKGAQRRTTVIRNGVDAGRMQPGPQSRSLRAEMAADPDAPIVLAMSRLDPRKRIDHAIKAVAALPKGLEHVQLAIAGAPSLDAGHEPHLRNLASDLLGTRARFMGTRQDVAELLRCADAFVLASSLEGLPLSVLEAQACGTPVVAYPTAGVPEVVEHMKTGLLAREGDVSDLATQLTTLLRDDELRDVLARNGRDRVMRDSTLDQQADRHAALLRRVLDVKR